MGSDAESAQVTSARRTGRRGAPIVGRWWSVDPGEKHVGVAQWHGDALVAAREVSPSEYKSMLRQIGPALIVIEAFSLRSPKWTGAQSRQAVETLKLIGYTQALVDDHHDGRVVEQQPSVRHVAQSSKHWRLLQKENRIVANSHARSAVAHGVYYLHFAKR